MATWGRESTCAGVVSLALAGCSSSDGGSTEGGVGGSAALVPLTNEQRVAEFAAATSRLESRFNSEFDEIPRNGAATYSGFAGMVIHTGAGDLTLVGDAEMRLDFFRRELAGEITDVFGDQGGVLGDYTGQVSFTNGELRATRPNDLAFDYEGALNGQGNTILVDGSATGVFKGTPIRGVLANSDPGDTVTLNGAPAPVTMSVAVEP